MQEKQKRNDPRDIIVRQLVEKMEQGELVWRSGTMTNDQAQNGLSGRTYTGSNKIILWIKSMLENYGDHRWVTFNQMQKYNENKEPDRRMTLAKGSKGTKVSYMSIYSRKLKRNLTPNETKDAKRILEGFQSGELYQNFQAYTVFNAEQFINFPTLQINKSVAECNTDLIDKIATQLHVACTYEGGQIPCYLPAMDAIRMPSKERFMSHADLYATALHEMGHATGHETRLNREMDYAREELVAELTSVFLMTEFRLSFPNETIDNNAAYLQHWIGQMNKDTDYLFEVVNDAEAACNMIVEASGIERHEQEAIIDANHIELEEER